MEGDGRASRLLGVPVDRSYGGFRCAGGLPWENVAGCDDVQYVFSAEQNFLCEQTSFGQALYVALDSGSQWREGACRSHPMDWTVSLLDAVHDMLVLSFRIARPTALAMHCD